MSRILRWTAALVVSAAAAAAAHDLFLKPRDFFVAPNSALRVNVLNGTFSKSENSITRDRVLGIHVAGPAGTTTLDTASWSADGDTSVLSVEIGESGTYVLGASTAPRLIALKADQFNEYLRSDGIPDVLARRRRLGHLRKDAKERYAKHVKAVVQAGATRSESFGTVFGYPAEIVPLDNPYALRAGAILRVRALVDGQPVANQYVVAGGRTAAGGRIPQRAVRTDADGVAKIVLRSRGVWYVKFIHMVPVEGDAEADHESKWATLTFGIR